MKKIKNFILQEVFQLHKLSSVTHTSNKVCGALRDLIPRAQLKKREKHPWRSVTLKVTLLHGCFSRFLNCTNGTKLRKASHM